MGVGCSLVVCFFSGNLLFNDSEKGLGVYAREALLLPLYLLWLLWQIVVANFHVLYLVLHPKMMDKINPRLMSFRSDGPNCDFSRYVLANSITLTPGTVTVSLDDDVFLVHAISDETAKGVPEPMQQKVANVFNRKE